MKDLAVFLAVAVVFLLAPEAAAQLNCTLPTAITNGQMYISTLSNVSYVTYTCNTGFRFVNATNAVRTCVLGVWSGSDPVCTVVTCSTLSNIPNGVVTAPTTTYGSVARYSCNSGYELSGGSTRTCLVTGAWTRASATCEKKDNTLAIALGASLGGLALIGLLIAGACLLSRRTPTPPRGPFNPNPRMNPYPRRPGGRPLGPGRRY